MAWMLYSTRLGFLGVYESARAARAACPLGARRPPAAWVPHQGHYGVMPVSGLKEALEVSERLRQRLKERK